MAGLLPDMQSMDVRPVLQAYEHGIESARKVGEQALNRRVGQTAADEGLDAASKTALAGGDVATGIKFSELSLDRKLKAVEVMGRAAIDATTPEKWATNIDILRRHFGNDSVAGFENYSSRQSAILLSKNAHDQLLQQKAMQDFSAAIGGGGQQQPSPPAPSAARPAAPSTARTWGDQEAVNAGLYEPNAAPSNYLRSKGETAVSNPVVAQAPAPTAAPVSAPAPAASQPGAPDLQRLVIGLSNPNLPQGMRQVGLEMLKSKLEESKLPNDTKEYLWARSSGDPEAQKPYTEWTRSNKRAGAINIVNVGEKEYDKQTAKDMSELNRKMIEGAGAARTKIATLDQLGSLLSNPKIFTGAGANEILELKKWARTAGINVGDLGGAEAVRAISNQYALELRNPAGGAGMPGAMSDSDRVYLQAMSPGLGNTPQGNALIIDYNKRIAQRSVDVERLRQAYVRKNGGRLDEGFYNELETFANANPIFNKNDQMKLQETTTTLEQLEAEAARRRGAK